MKKILAITFLVLLLIRLQKFTSKPISTWTTASTFFLVFKLTFVENPGMAYGLHFGGILGKYFLVILRLFLIGGMVYMFKKWLQQGASNYLLIPMAIIFAGAIGNIIDGMFYGLIFDSGTVYDQSIDRWIGYGGVSKFVL
jgi:signal peptidase II